MLMLRSSVAKYRVLVQNHLRLTSVSAAAVVGSSVDLNRPSDDSTSSATSLLGLLGGTAVVAATLLPNVARSEAPPSDTGAKDLYAQPTELKGLPKEIILYQYEVCPYCNKVKAFLDYHKLPYRTVEVSPLTKAELKWSDYQKVPLVLLDDEALGDSTAVISRLAAELKQQQPQQHEGQHTSTFGQWVGNWLSPGPSESAADGAHQVKEERWRKWVDDRLVKVVTVNIYRSMGESFQTFNYINDTGKFGMFEGPATRTSGAVIMWFIAGRLVKKYGIKGDLRQELYAVADEWVDALGGRPFMGGDAPDLADLSAFGVIRSITATSTFMDLMHKTPISEWYERMMGAVGDSARTEAI